MRARGIRRGCWGCDESRKITHKECGKSILECGKFIKDEGDFPGIHIITHHATWDDCVEYYNGRYKGIA
jgi:hypothetical protein